jgi:hypothetical protein
VNTAFNPKDRVLYARAAKGSPLFASPLAGIVINATADGIEVEVRHRQATGREPERLLVEPAALIPRTMYSPEFNEPHTLIVNNIEIHASQQPDGRWLGSVDGRSVTSPLSTEEAALASAYKSMHNGHYLLTLATEIQTYEGWVQDPKTAPHFKVMAKDKLPDLRVKLARLKSACPDLFPL